MRSLARHVALGRGDVKGALLTRAGEGDVPPLTVDVAGAEHVRATDRLAPHLVARDRVAVIQTPSFQIAGRQRALAAIALAPERQGPAFEVERDDPAGVAVVDVQVAGVL